MTMDMASRAPPMAPAMTETCFFDEEGFLGLLEDGGVGTRRGFEAEPLGEAEGGFGSSGVGRETTAGGEEGAGFGSGGGD